MLFVEDDRSVAQMYKLKLELDGYQVDVATDGEMPDRSTAWRRRLQQVPCDGA